MSSDIYTVQNFSRICTRLKILVCRELNFEVAVKLGRMKNARACEAVKFYARFTGLLLSRAGKIAFQALAKLPSARL